MPGPHDAIHRAAAPASAPARARRSRRRPDRGWASRRAAARCPGAKRVIYGGVAQGAGRADPGERVVRVDLAHQADDGAELEQGDGGGRVVEVELPGPQRGPDRGGRAWTSTLSAEAERGGRRDGGADHVVQLQRIGPEGLVAEGVEPEDLPALRPPVPDRARRRRRPVRSKRRGLVGCSSRQAIRTAAIPIAVRSSRFACQHSPFRRSGRCFGGPAPVGLGWIGRSGSRTDRPEGLGAARRRRAEACALLASPRMDGHSTGGPVGVEANVRF